MRVRPSARSCLLALSVATVVSSVSGCSAPASGAAEEVALDFARPTTDAVTACRLLSAAARQALTSETGRPCADSLAGARPPGSAAVVSSEVDGHSAQVVLDHDTVFLALFPSGWAVTAAGCTRSSTDPAVPYDCAVKAG